MRTCTLEILAANLALPLNSAAQKADGARFALMLSILSEGRYGEPLQAEQGAEVFLEHHRVTEPAFHLDLSLNQALSHNNPHSFNLLNSLYNERDRYLYGVSDGQLLPTRRPESRLEKTNNPESLMREIAQSREQALLMG